MLDDNATRDFVWLRYGAKGRQLARILRRTGGCVIVQKFRVKSANWTKPIWTLDYCILGPLTLEERRSQLALEAMAALSRL